MIAACLKWADHRPDVDPLTGAVHTDPRTSGASDADLAALEWALRMGEVWGDEVVAFTAGPVEAEAVLRTALAAGAVAGVRAAIAVDAPSESVAAAIADTIATRSPVRAVVCGAWSVDRGSGSVPAYLAAHLGAAQGLGLISLAIEPGAIVAERRLDLGRRERLRIPAPLVASVEGGSARLRRAPLAGVLRAREASIDVRPAVGSAHRERPVRVAPFRPRPRDLAPPSGATARERVLHLTGSLAGRRAAQTLFLPPADAARTILERLQAWGYLP